MDAVNKLRTIQELTPPIGTKVIALMSCTDTEAWIFGYGTFIGFRSDPLFTQATKEIFGEALPLIKLDSGVFIWGPECWWGSSDFIIDHFNLNVKQLHIVDIELVRREGKQRGLVSLQDTIST